MTHRQQHGCAYLLIESIESINKEEPPVLLLGILLPQEPHHVDPPFNPCLQAAAELLRPAGFLGLHPRHHHHSLLQHPTPGLSHAYWSYPRALVNDDEVPQHQFPVGFPG